MSQTQEARRNPRVADFVYITLLGMLIISVFSFLPRALEFILFGGKNTVDMLWAAGFSLLFGGLFFGFNKLMKKLDADDGD